MRNKAIKLLICSVLAAVLCFAATGCLFEHNYEKDYMQVIATVKPVTYEKKEFELDADGNHVIENGTVKEKVVATFESKEVNIYKTQLVTLWNNNASSLLQSGYTAEDAAEYLLNQLVNRQLLLNEADALLKFGDIEWTLLDSNYVARSVYSSIDALIVSLRNEVLNDHDQPTQDAGEDASTETTYPVRPTEDADEESPETAVKWTPDRSSYPAIGGDSDLKSIERETVRRLVDYLANLVEDNRFADDKEKGYFKADVEKMKKLIADYREEDVYPMLYDPDYDPEKGEGNGTYIAEFMWGESARETRKLELLQKHIESGVTVTDEEVLSSYNSILQTQRTTFTDSSAYDTAATSDTTNVIYTPNDNYVYVKHILLPFSDEQKAELTAFKEEGVHTSEEIALFRDNLANNIVAYKHVDGEDDKTKPMSVKQIMATVTSQMSRFKYNPREAERLFDSLIYDYGTDPGSFGNVKGYGVKYKLGTGESETYMKEFAAAARDMRDTLQVGQVYGKPVITDYGVHIMYLASTTEAGKVKGLYDYQTPAEYKTVYDIIKNDLFTSKRTAAYNAWAMQKISDGANNIERFTKRYKDIYED